MEIPGENLYYVLCYAWERLDRLEAVPDDVRTSTFDLPQNLLARLLHDSFSQVLRRGLDRGYLEQAEDTRRPRGKLDLPSTARRALRVRGQVRVRFEELSRDVLHNRIVKTTMLRLAAVEELSTDLKRKLTRLVQRIADVGEVDLREDLFRRVQIHRNNADYGFLLDLCRMIARHLLPEAGAGAVRFRDFTTDEREMGRLFEDFVRGFLRTEHPRLGVSRAQEHQVGRGARRGRRPAPPAHGNRHLHTGRRWAEPSSLRPSVCRNRSRARARLAPSRYAATTCTSCSRT